MNEIGLELHFKHVNLVGVKTVNLQIKKTFVKQPRVPFKLSVFLNYFEFCFCSLTELITWQDIPSFDLRFSCRSIKVFILKLVADLKNYSE